MNKQDRFFFALGPAVILLIWIFLPWGRSEGWRAGGDSPVSTVTAELVGYAFEAQGDSRPLIVGRSAEAGFRLHSAPVAPRAARLTPPKADNASWEILPARAGLTLRLLANPVPRSTAPQKPRVKDTSVRAWRRALHRPRSEPIVLGCRDPVATVTPVRLHSVSLAPLRGDVRSHQRDAGGTSPRRGHDATRSAEPEVVWLEAALRPTATSEVAGLDLLACPGGAVWQRPRQPGEAGGELCATNLDGWTRVRRCWSRPWTRLWRDAGPSACVDPWDSTWGAGIEADGDARLVLPWGEASGQDFWLTMNGPTPQSIRVGVVASGPGSGAASAPGRLAICPAGSAESLGTVGPLELRGGDLLAIGRTRFLVRTEATSGGQAAGGQAAGEQTPGALAAGARNHRLELYHVRDPTSPGYFSASAGHDAYHPNRRALWNVPSCDQGEMLTLAVEPQATSSETTASAAELALQDRRRQDEIMAAIRDHDVPHELPAVALDRTVERALLSLCAVPGSGRGLDLRLVADSAAGIGLRTDLDGDARTLLSEEATVPIGSRGDPAEVLVDLEGNLLRVAPAAGPRVTRRTRLGLAAYLILILVLQAWPLTLARIERRRSVPEFPGEPNRARTPAWPAVLASPALQQTAGIAITGLLLLGTSYQLFLGLHPELVGKPDYLQAFLQGSVAVCVVIAAAAGFSFGGGLETRCVHALLSASAALLAAAGWWWLDGLGDASGSWFSAWRDNRSAAASTSPETMGKLLLAGGSLCAAAAAVLFLCARLRWSRAAEHLARLAVRVPLAGFVVAASAGLLLGVVQRSALAFELALLAGLAWYAAVYWAFVSHGRLIRQDDMRRKAAAMSMASGLLMLLFLGVFFVVGADLPDSISFASFVLGLTILGGALRIARGERSTSLLRVVALWMPASILGMGFASFVLRDMGSVAAWLPALLTGFFLWLVRPEEIDNRREEPRKALSHLLLALGSGLVLLGLLDVFTRVVQGLDWRVLERPQQRLALAEDISYITSGEWITQVRWLASQQDDTLQWVPNANSDIAIFGLAANLGVGWAVVASMVLLGIAGCAALAADQALREGRALVVAGGGDRLRPVLYRTCGLILGMVCVLLISQWLVHLATGVVLHLPITGLVFPWISHGNTSHLLYTAAILLPMAAITALGWSRDR